MVLVRRQIRDGRFTSRAHGRVPTHIRQVPIEIEEKDYEHFRESESNRSSSEPPEFPICK